MRQVKDRIDPLAVPQGQGPQAVQSAVVASPTGPVGAPRPANQFEDLAQALSGLNPALQRYAQVQDMRDPRAARDAAIEGKAAATRALSADPLGAIKLPEAMPTTVPAAYKREFMDGYREVVGAGHFARVSSTLQGDYLQAKAQLQSPQDLEAWLAKRVQEENNGITDPLMLVSGQHILAQTAHAIRSDFNGEVDKRMLSAAQSNTLETIAAVIPDNVSNPDDVVNALHGTILPMTRKLGLQSTPEVVERTLEHVRAVSMRRGGVPELFDAFDRKSPEGIVPSQTGKGLEELVQRYKHEALAQQQAGISKDNEQAQAQLLKSFDDMTREGTPIDFEKAIMPYVGKGNLLSAEQGMTIFRKNQDEVEKQQRTATAMRLVVDPNGNGAAAYLDTKDRQAAVDKFAEGYLGNLQQLLAQPLTPDSTAQVKNLTRGLINVYRNVPEDAKQIKDWVDLDTKTVAQKGAAPSQAFLLKNDLYRVLKAEAPHMLPRVFGDDAARMHEQFMRSRDDRHSPEEAYASALTMVDPAARKLAAERIKDPAFKKSVNDAIHNSFVNGWDQIKASMPELWGLNSTAAGNANSEPYVMAWAQQEAERELQANPQMSVDQAVQRVQARALQNFMWDPNTHSIIQVPPGHVGPDWEKRYHNFTAGIVKDVAARFGNDVQTFIHYDGNGQFAVMTRNPDTTRTYTLDDVQKAYATKYEWNKDELGQLNAIQKRMREGTYDPGDYAKDRELITKGNMLNAHALWASTWQ